ncbi:MAG: glycosyltransferase [Chloroflexi bacterium]|nr:glycosyltransferase [Chloroflexota bacterium]
MKKPRIAMLSEHASPLALLGGEDAGGQNVYVSEVSTNVSALGFQVDVFTRQDSEKAQEINEWAKGVRVINLRAGPATFLKKDELWVHMPQFYDSLLSFAHKQRIKYDLIHANFWMSGSVACDLRREWAVPFVEIFHALGRIKRLYQGEADTSPEDRIDVENRVVDTADVIIAQCPAEKEELVELYGADEERISIVPSAVDTDVFKPVPKRQARKTLGLNPNDKILVYVGRLLPRKAIDDIVYALAILAQRTPRVPRLLIVGGETEHVSPENHEEVRRLAGIAASLGVGHLLTFIGRRRHVVLKYYYSAADVCVSTPWYEPFGLVPLEAMACGTPMVVSEVGGMKFTVQDGKTGFHVPPKDPAALAAKLELLLNDGILRETMGRRARERVQESFTWRQVAKRMALIYDQLLSAQLARDRVPGAHEAGYASFGPASFGQDL